MGLMGEAGPEAVAPFTGAWIETGICRKSIGRLRVAPFTGAWIETFVAAVAKKSLGRALHGRVD